MNLWFIYIVRCADGSLYTGITKDIQRRIHEHNNDNRTAAAYTRGRRPVKLAHEESCQTRSQATKREYQIKQLTRKKKEALIKMGVDNSEYIE